MNLSFLENLVIKYLEAHPELIERLITDLFGKLLDQIEKKPAA